MRLKVLFGIAIMCVALCASSSFARYKCYSTPDTCYVCWDTTLSPWVLNELDLGVCDTVRIGCPLCVDFSSVAVGDSFKVPIYLYTTNAVGAFTFGFRHDGRGLKFGGYNDMWDPTGGLLTQTAQWGGIGWAIDTITTDEPKTDSGSALMAWIDISGTRPIARNTTSAAKLLGTIYLVLADTIHQTVRFDSTYYPPSGPFILSCRDSTGPTAFLNLKLTPQFAICTLLTVPPCDINLPVQEVNTKSLPQKFELGQNTPNPFNPSTTIMFAVPKPAEVRIEVFNVLGQKVKTLANEFSKAGYKRVEWDGTDANGSSVASGVYLYRMTAGDFRETKKMLLLK